MHYYIDGYNLLFRVLRSGSDIRKQREEITLDLEKKASLLNLDITLVFDSHYQEDDNTRSHFKSLEIIFTAKGESADEFILQKLKESTNPSQHTVVTSDKILARLCRLRLGNTESIDEFLGKIGKRYKNKHRPKYQPSSLSITTIKLIEPEKIKEESCIPLPKTKNSVEECFNYYLETFEKAVPPLPQINTPPKKIPPQKKGGVKKRQLSKEEAELSDALRWQKAFEDNSSREQ